MQKVLIKDLTARRTLLWVKVYSSCGSSLHT